MILEVPPALVKLLRGLPWVAQIIPVGEKLPNFDFHCPLLSLPLALGTTLETIPSFKRYLHSAQGKRIEWESRLGQRIKPRIGLVWSGSATHKNDHNRSISLAVLLPYLPEGYDYVCLQKEMRDQDKPVLAASHRIRFFGNELADFSDTAALCDLMDLVISVDTSVAHLAGALGRPTWILLPYVPDWRWLLDRDDSPWYPSVRLYRQPVLSDWSGALEKMGADMEAGMYFKKALD